MVKRKLPILLVGLLMGPVSASSCKKDKPEEQSKISSETNAEGNAEDKPAGLPAQSASAETNNPAPTRAPSGAAEEMPEAPKPKESISGTIVVPKARAQAVSKGDTIYIVVRKAGGAPGPASMLAVQRHQAGEFPMPFVISGRDAMIPGIPFEGPVSINVRVDKDGEALTRQKGEIYGEANGIPVGAQDIMITLNMVQKEDKKPRPRL